MEQQIILVVDDIAANRNLLGDTLEPRGYEVLLAPNGTTALKVAERARPDIILMDVNMPDMDGYEACRQLKANADTELAEIPVIFITANDDQDSLVKGFEAGGVDYIVKPFQEKEVLMRVSTHLKIHTLTKALEAKNEALGAEVERRREAERKANEANQAKSDFLSFISHEMRSPLNAIIGFSEELVDSLESESLEDAQSIRRSAEHLLALISNLLDLSKIEAGKMPLHLEHFNPKTLIQTLARDLDPLAKKNANALTIDTNGWDEDIHADPTKVKQVLTNLISNACKFTQDGTIGVSLGGIGHQNETSFSIKVTDTGIGMTREEMEKVFKPYQQANASVAKTHGGTGLGLSISRQFCRLMGGDLAVESEEGRGTVFSINLPVNVVSEGSIANQ